jgi:hypothetical protein
MSSLMARLPALLRDQGEKVCAAWFGAVKLAAARSQLVRAAMDARAAYHSPKIV